VNIATTADTKTESLTTRFFQSIRRNIQSYILLIAVLAIWLLFSITTHGLYMNPQNISNLFRQMCVTSFLAIGMVLVIVTGSIDLSVGKLAGFVSVVAAYLQYYVWVKLLPGQVVMPRKPTDADGGHSRDELVAWLFEEYLPWVQRQPHSPVGLISINHLFIIHLLIAVYPRLLSQISSPA